MALSMLVAIVAAPALLGTQEAIRQSQSKEKREEHRARRCNLIASCVKSSLRSREINGRPVVLRDNKLWIDTGTSDGTPYGHPFAGYYLPYPDTKYEGLVTTITDVAPIMNWIYIDRNTHEVKYGVRLDAQPNLTGPFDCTRQDRRLTFDGWEGWCAVEEFPTLWALYYDLDDNGLMGKVSEGTRVLEVELSRKEKRFQKESEARQQDQTTKRAVDANEDAPVDEPITVQPELKTPGVVGMEGQAPDQPAPEPPKPFIIPKMQLFQDLPYSVTQVPPPPPTPPPAYSTVPLEPPTNVQLDIPASRAQQPYTTKASLPPQPTTQPELPTPPVGRTIAQRQKQTGLSTKTPSDSLLTPAPLRGTPINQKRTIPLYPGLSGSPPPPTPLATTASTSPPPPASLRARPPNEQQRTPPARPSRSPQGASPIQATPTNEKRTTPKRNRNSGTRTIAQAQVFEAWARGETPKQVSSKKDSGSPPRPVSRAVSSASEYSNPSRTSVLDADDMFKDRPDGSTLPPVSSMHRVEEHEEAPMQAPDPAVFGGFMVPPKSIERQNEPAASNSRSDPQVSLQRKNSYRASPDNGASREPLPPVPPASRTTKVLRKSPGKGALRSPGADRSEPSIDRTRTISPEQQRRPSASQISPRGASPSISRNRTQSPELKRRPSAARTVSRNMVRTAQTSRYSPSPAPPLPRSGSVSSLQSQNELAVERSSPTPKPLSRTNTAVVPAKRKGMTATMTSGTSNRAMTLRVGGNEAASNAPRLERNRTNSSLYREIDDLVSAPGRNRSGTIPSSSKRDDRQDGERDVDKRPPPLRRAATSRVQATDGYRGEGGERSERARDARRDILRPRRRDSGERRS